ncbi:valine--tRNA ligase-like [Rhagoletis pomonella]|uniref:valine--tRNA ligase-like n=1 Tax=Rhagoletis pomonella TaxID=28610 RepID=UPI0017842908|nr:valine--tRNA ligase-like [Rhagoletis pomonella]
MFTSKPPIITIFNDDGYILGDYGEFKGMKRFDCHKRILEKLKELGLYRETVNNPMVVHFYSRSKDVVEPMIKPQWYLKCDQLAADATEAVRKGYLKIITDHHTKIWYPWMEGIRDWCVSRQSQQNSLASTTRAQYVIVIFFLCFWKLVQ